MVAIYRGVPPTIWDLISVIQVRGFISITPCPLSCIVQAV